MRDYKYIDLYLDTLIGDVYDQPLDVGHTSMCEYVVNNWVSRLDIHSVLDVGCGQGVAYPSMRALGLDYAGVALGNDVLICKEKGLPVTNQDFHFLTMPDSSVDLIFSRHSLEHSPMPLIALMEWHRVSRNLLCVVLPNPDFFEWAGLNHYSVMHPNQIEFLLDRAGWHVIWSDFEEKQELRYMCEKKRTSLYEDHKKKEE